MSIISDKKCPICYSTFPTKVVFCPICGTELETQIAKVAPTTESPYDFPSNNPTSRPSFRDEPIETKTESGDYVLDSTQFAWNASDSLVPLRMKGQISYSDNFKPPKLQLRFFKNLSLGEMCLIGTLGVLTSLALIIFINLSLLLVLGILPISWSSLLFTILSFFAITFLICVFNSRIAKTIGNWKDSSSETKNSNIFTYGLIYLIQIVTIGAISITFVEIFQRISQGSNQNVAIYLPFLLTAIVLSIISPIFRIAKILSSLRESSVFQSFLDAFQFPKYSLKRIIQSGLISFLVPASIFTAGLNSFSKIFLSIFSPAVDSAVSGSDYAICSLVFLFFSVSVVVGSFVDINGIHYYEGLIKEYVEPPSLSWIKGKYSSSQTESKKKNSKETESRHFSGEREERCPACSALMIDGAEFCTDCGKKIVI